MIHRPRLSPPGAGDNKYSRGLVAVIGGEMPGASRLAARAAMHGGSGYVILAAPAPQHGLPDALVTRVLASVDDLLELLADDRVRALLIGPGLGRGEQANEWLDHCIASNLPLVLDGDALTLLGHQASARLAERAVRLAADRIPTVLTPHEGEFDRMFPGEGEKGPRTAAAGNASYATIIHKGANTVVGGQFGYGESDEGSPWLSVAGTGDVLAGIMAARVAQRDSNPRDAAFEAVWLHTRIADLAGPAFIADDLIPLIPRAIAECLPN